MIDRKATNKRRKNQFPKSEGVIGWIHRVFFALSVLSP